MTGKGKRNQTLIGTAIPNMPWQDRPSDCTDVVWRYSGNPVITREALPGANSIFNSSVIPYQGKFIGIFRIDNTRMVSNLYVGHSNDGLKWDIDKTPIKGLFSAPGKPFAGGYDPRVSRLEDRYYVTWCNDYYGPTIGIAWTKDFKTFHQLENAFVPYNRNGVLFPRRIKGKYFMLHRPSGPGHNRFGSIFCSQSPDLTHWGVHRLAMEPNNSGWEYDKIGAGPNPIETKEGWLLIYHGVHTTCTGFVYRAGAALLDLDEPWKVIGRSKNYILGPQETYERVGDVSNVVFPCAALADSTTGRIAIYYGCADTVTGLAFAYVDELLKFVKTNTR
jgi:beta-1,4-mannooligosaccharide/beta-1,4-mannosyl-N-acetylglucosamine phosphorylase